MKNVDMCYWPGSCGAESREAQTSLRSNEMIAGFALAVDSHNYRAGPDARPLSGPCIFICTPEPSQYNARLLAGP